MTIQEKMQSIINSVLPDCKYEVKIVDDHNWEAVGIGTWDSYFRQTIKDINNHWREEIAGLIKIIVDKKLKKALNEV